MLLFTEVSTPRRWGLPLFTEVSTPWRVVVASLHRGFDTLEGGPTALAARRLWFWFRAGSFILVLALDECSLNASIGAERKAWQGPGPEELRERYSLERERVVK